MKYRTADECRGAGITYHMSPREIWDEQKEKDSYLPEAFDQDGFIHATNGLNKLAWVGNQFYTGDRRPYVVLVLDVSRIVSPLRYEDSDELFPHIYGPLNIDSVIGELVAVRDEEGRFIDFSNATR